MDNSLNFCYVILMWVIAPFLIAGVVFIFNHIFNFPFEIEPELEPEATSTAPSLPAAAHDFACSICMEPFNAVNNVSASRCGHVFHTVCALTWLEESETCPNCRATCTIESTIPVDFQAATKNNITSKDQADIDEYLECIRETQTLVAREDAEFEIIQDSIDEIQVQIADLKLRARQADSILNLSIRLVSKSLIDDNYISSN